jgi:hypothetical protein
MGIGAAVGAAATVVSSVVGATTGSGGGTEQRPVAGIGDPAADPLIAGLSLGALTNLGIAPTESQLREQSPFSKFLAQSMTILPMDSAQLSRLLKQMRTALKSVEAGGGIPTDEDEEADERTGTGRLTRLLAATGTTLQQLLAEESEFNSTFDERLTELKGVAQEQKNVIDSLRSQIGGTIQDLPDASAEGLAARAARERLVLDDSINRLADEGRLDLLRVGNLGNFNPGRSVGDLEEERFRSLRDSDLSSLARALAGISAEQGAAGTNLGLLQTEQNRRDALAGTVGGLRQGSQASLSSISSTGDNRLGQAISLLPASLATGARAGSDLLAGLGGSTAPATASSLGFDTSQFPTLFGPNPFG